MTNYITLSSGQLYNGGNVFRFSGANCYWLGLSDHVNRNNTVNPDYPTHFQIDDALQTAKEMGCSVVRAHTLGISTGNLKSIWPSRANRNSAAFETIDYTIYRAGLLGLRLIIPLTDNHYYYHGGLHNFTDWRGVATSAFYTNTTVIADFKAYINDVITTQNRYNSSLEYYNDPTIMAWETGNELSPLGSSSDFTTWTDTISRYIKTIAPNQLVMDGTTGVIPTGNVSLTNVDILTGHFYPIYVSKISTDSSTANTNNKTYIVGEYDWRNQNNVSAITTIDTVEHSGYGGPNSAKTVVTVQGAYDYQYQINQTGVSGGTTYFQLQTGNVYVFSFYAKQSSTFATLPVRAIIQSNAGSYTLYRDQTFNVTTSWQPYSFTYTATSDDANMFIGFNLAAQVGTIWIDATSFTSNVGSNLIQNPNFTTTLPPWVVNEASPSDSLATLLSDVEGNTHIAGDIAWNIWPHDDTYGFILDNDIGSIYYPNGQITTWNPDTDQANRFEAMRTHGYTMQGLSSPYPRISIASPANLTVTKAGGTDTIYWQGVVGALQYTLVTAPTPTGPWTKVNNLNNAAGNYTWSDFDCPIRITPSTGGGMYYKVQAQNYAGSYGGYSNVVP